MPETISHYQSVLDAYVAGLAAKAPAAVLAGLFAQVMLVGPQVEHPVFRFDADAVPRLPGAKSAQGAKAT